jgi:hypothetical protein
MKRLSKQIEIDYSNVLVATFGLMLRGGMRAADLLPICVKSLERAETKSRIGRRSQGNGLIAAALVLDGWHRNRRYLTATGTPKPVPLRGPAPSVEGLIRLQRVKERVSNVTQSLKAFHLIVPHGGGLYTPASDVAVVAARDPIILQHAARALSTLLETVGQNVGRAPNLPPLIERVAEVPDLPRKELRAFRAFTQAQGRTFIRTVNDWLESRRARSPKRRADGTVRAGIHTYAYVAPSQRSPLKI